jgi:hypothetical protein
MLRTMRRSGTLPSSYTEGLKPWHPLVFDVGSIAEDGESCPTIPSHIND